MKMIHPDNHWKRRWDLLIILITLFTVVEIPVRLAFPGVWRSSLLWSELFITFCFSIDILLNFFTSVHWKGQLLDDRKSVARLYKRTWLPVDILSAFPFFLLTGKLFLEAGHALRFLHLLQLNRLLKLFRFRAYAKGVQKQHVINPGLYRLLFFVVLISIVAHWIACIWILLGGAKDAGGDEWNQYSYALYWAITTLTTVGYGDITPTTIVQRYFTMTVMLTGVAAYGYVIGNVTSFIGNLDLTRADYRRKMEEITSFMNYRSVSPELQRRVQDYYEHLWESRLGKDENEILSEIPDPLRTDLALYMRKDLITKVPFFRRASEELLRDIVMALKPRVFLPGTKIIEKGEAGTCMYIVSSGSVDVVSDDGKTVFATLREGSIVGEMALVLDQVRSATVRTVGYCDLYVLEKEDFDEVLQKYPDFAKHIDSIATERLKKRHGRKKG